MQRAVRLSVVSWLGLAALSVHADERIGPEIPVSLDGNYVSASPRVVSDGVGTLVVWTTGTPAVHAARIDGAGNVSGPLTLSTGFPHKRDPDIATDGRTALVVWSEELYGHAEIKGMRLGPNGELLDAIPFTIEARNVGTGALLDTHVAFDGSLFRVAWGRAGNDTRKVYTRQISPDGSAFSRVRKVRVRNMARVPFDSKVACLRNGQCVVTWLQTAGFDVVEGVRMQGDTFLDAEVLRLLGNVQYYRISSTGVDYVVVGTRYNFSCPMGYCVDAFAGRVSGTGVPLDFGGIQINNPPPAGSFVADVGVTFDGTDYLTTFLDFTPPCGFDLFGARISLGGTVSNPEVPGFLLHSGSSTFGAALAATHTHAVAAWHDFRPNSCTSNTPVSVYAQRALAHADVSGFQTVEIGSIGSLSVREQTVLRRTLAASGLNPATVTFSASNLPPGAVLDAETRAFQWQPNPNEAGVYPGVHFEATDGVQTVSEDVTITVDEGSLALCGTVERQNVPVPNVAVQLRGGHAKPRTVVSDAAGRFCFYYLIQADYRLTVGKPSRKQWGATPLLVVMGGSDLTDAHFIVRLLGP